eukprot:gene9228-10202_t
MNCSKQRLYVLFILLVLLTLIYISFVYEIPRGVQRALFSRPASSNEKRIASEDTGGAAQITIPTNDLRESIDKNHVSKGLLISAVKNSKGSLYSVNRRPILSAAEDSVHDFSRGSAHKEQYLDVKTSSASSISPVVEGTRVNDNKFVSTTVTTEGIEAETELDAITIGTLETDDDFAAPENKEDTSKHRAVPTSKSYSTSPTSEAGDKVVSNSQFTDITITPEFDNTLFTSKPSDKTDPSIKIEIKTKQPSKKLIVGKKNELKKRLPSVIIIGSKKGGTRALLKFLSKHPSIEISHKEVHFFDKYYENGIDWYIEQMPETYPGQITMEKTPGYFVRPYVPERLSKLRKERAPNMKFILIVRNPITRAISDYTQGLYQHKLLEKETGRKPKYKSFESKVFLDTKKRIVNTRSTLISTGLYSIYLKRWLKYFDIRDFHFVSGEELIKAPWKELYSVQKFLNVPALITKEHFYFNETKRFYCLAARKVNGTVETALPQCFNENKGRQHPAINLKTTSALQKFFRRFNQKFYKMVGRNFGWS